MYTIICKFKNNASFSYTTKLREDAFEIYNSLLPNSCYIVVKE